MHTYAHTIFLIACKTAILNNASETISNLENCSNKKINNKKSAFAVLVPRGTIELVMTIVTVHT